MLISHLYESYLNRLIIPSITNQIIERPINTGTTTSNKTASSPIIISIISFTIHKILLITTPDSAFIYKEKTWVAVLFAYPTYRLSHCHPQDKQRR